MALPLAAAYRSRAAAADRSLRAAPTTSNAGLVRAVGDGVFRADGLRLLRAVRLCAELDFFLDDDTAALVRRDAACLDPVAPERKRDELARILATDAGRRPLCACSTASACWSACCRRSRPVAASLSRRSTTGTSSTTCMETVVGARLHARGRASPPAAREAAFWRELWEQLAWLPGCPGALSRGD